MNLKVNYAKYLIFYGLQIKAKLFSVSVAELGGLFLEFWLSQKVSLCIIKGSLSLSW